MNNKTILAGLLFAQSLVSKTLFAASPEYDALAGKINKMFSASEQPICEELYPEYFMGESKKEYLFPNKIGSAGKLAGRVAVVSIFADDTETHWDLDSDEDLYTYDIIMNNMDIATEWITEQGKNYGVDVEFIYDCGEYEDLFYTAEFDIDMTDEEIYYYSDIVTWEYIEDNIDSSLIMKNHNADSIVYMLYLNTDFDNEAITCTRSYYEDMEYPYEICFIYMRDYETIQSPGIIAHEMLHTFGAPDLYMTDEQFGINDRYVRYAEMTFSNDIMRTCYDNFTGEIYFDKITNEITDITAYYIGWVDHSATIDRWGLGKYRLA